MLRFLSLLAAAVLAGCSLAPGYVRPDAPVPASWPTGAAYAPAQAGESTADAIAWQDFFLDPGLRRLVGIALENNRDLRVAALNVTAAQAQYRGTRADQLPTIAATAQGEYAHTPAGLTGGGTEADTSSSYGASFGFTAFELDLFGRLRSLSRSAFESSLSSGETQRSTQITLVAQVADAYLTLLADRALLALTEQTLNSQQASYRLTAATAAGGTSTALVLRQAQTAVETARANLAAYKRQVAQDENALALLLGQPLPRDLPATDLTKTLLLADLPAGLSSAVLLRRPDVLAAEHTLVAANADIGAARAAFFPSVSLTGSLGSGTLGLSSLFQPNTLVWAFTPTITLPIFTGGANRANLDYASAQQRIGVASYEKAIQTAFREVADALAARGTYGDQLQAQRDLTEAYADSYRLSELRFRSGVDSFLAVLVSQRELYNAQQSLITLQRDQLSSQVTLFKVLGGGWKS